MLFSFSLLLKMSMITRAEELKNLWEHFADAPINFDITSWHIRNWFVIVTRQYAKQRETIHRYNYRSDCCDRRYASCSLQLLTSSTRLPTYNDSDHSQTYSHSRQWVINSDMNTLCPDKETKMFFVIFPTKLGRF